MPAANQEKKAGGQLSGLTPDSVWRGSQAHAQLRTPRAAIAGTRMRTGTRRASNARMGSAR